MKVKNLLLAGLAVAAMTACSNDEIIDNDGIQTNGENAAMQINFQFPTTRVVSDGGTNAGIDIEYAATEITAVLVNKLKVVLEYTAQRNSKLKQETM